MSTVGDRIRQRRQKRGLTQERLAALAEISKGFLSDVETGTRSLSAEYLLRIAKALGVSLDYLMKGSPEPESAPEKKEVSLPASLVQDAKEEGWPMDITLALLDMKRQVIAHRSVAKNEDLETFDWKGFYNCVKKYL